MKNNKYFSVLLFSILIVACSNTQYTFTFNNYSNVDIESVVIHFDNSKLSLGYISVNQGKSYIELDFKVNKKIKITWNDKNMNNYNVIVDEEYISDSDPNYSFNLVDDGMKLVVSKHKKSIKLEEKVFLVTKLSAP